MRRFGDRRSQLGWRTGLGVAVVVASFAWALPAFASYADVVDALRHRPPDIARHTALAFVVVALFNLVAPSFSQRAALPGLTLRQAVWADWSTTTVTNVMPGGSAVAVGLTWAMYRSFGLARAAIARSIVVTGVWDVLVKLGAPLPALLWLSTQRPVDGTLVQAAVVGGVLFLIAVGLLITVLSGPTTALYLGRLIDRIRRPSDPAAAWTERLARLRSDTVSLLRERGRPLTVWTVVGHANLYVLLVLSLRMVGISPDLLGWAPILAAFAFGRLVTALPLTPGGLGVLEVGLTGALTAVAGTGVDLPAAAVVAGVLVFRFLTFAVPLPLGAGGLLIWHLRRS